MRNKKKASQKQNILLAEINSETAETEPPQVYTQLGYRAPAWGLTGQRSTVQVGSSNPRSRCERRRPSRRIPRFKFLESVDSLELPNTTQINQSMRRSVAIESNRMRPSVAKTDEKSTVALCSPHDRHSLRFSFSFSYQREEQSTAV